MPPDGTSPGRPDPSEEQLVRRLQSGNEDAFEELLRRHGGRMLAVARRFLRQEEDARDVVQEALLSAFRAIDGFAGGARLSTWLHRIVVNAALMQLRRRRRKSERSIDELLPHFLEDGHHAQVLGPWRPTPHDSAEREQLRELVRARIDELPETHRTVLLLRDIEGLDTKETADLLGIRPGNVKVRLHRARQALRTLLDPWLRGATS